VHVQVRDALADDVVLAHEAALGAERGRHRRADPPHPGEQRPDQVLGQVGQRHVVLLRGDEHVALEHRPGVEEPGRDVVGEHHVRGHGPGDDAAEKTVGHAGTLRDGPGLVQPVPPNLG
jgi:hypothetical protein